MRLPSKGIFMSPVCSSSRMRRLASSRVFLSGYSIQLKIGVSSGLA
jgi:hypothetical protein